MASDDRKAPSTRPPPPSHRRHPARITIYETKGGVWTLWPRPGGIAVEADLAPGYRVGEGPSGQLCVLGPPGELSMSADEAVRARVLNPLVHWQ